MTTSRHYSELIAQGVCPHCANRPVISGMTICEHCKTLTYPKMASARRKQYAIRKEAGLCTRCGKVSPVSGEKNCQSCKDYLAQYRAKLPASTKEHRSKTHQKWRTLNQEKVQTKNQRYLEKLRHDVFQHYGNKCSCCGESRPEFLTIDHVNGKGNEHRRSLFKDNIGGKRFWAWIRRNGYSPEYQILCWNCNMAKAHYGVCPHQQ